MDFHKSHIAKISLIALLLLIIPLLSSSMRPPYACLIIHLLIIALGAESGVLTNFTNPPADDKIPVAAVEVVSMECDEYFMKVAEKPAEERASPNVTLQKVVNKCPSTPSIFFIGTCEAEEEAMEEEDEEEVGDLSGAELFAKAETFIGNFYKQLKIQKEESWKKTHGFYQKAI